MKTQGLGNPISCRDHDHGIPYIKPASEYNILPFTLPRKQISMFPDVMLLVPHTKV